ncbi:MAG: phosphomethylpyrimidine synthase ThiC [Deltaproteobacteria bacterium]|nr:phosphomethylpyrimidine synthase ThiC [Deltaproteobacteria bacterium]
MKYTTQMDAARKGIITKEMKIAAKKENINIKKLASKIAEGKVIIPANKAHKSLDPEAIGESMRTKINVNLGISKDCSDIEAEIEKVKYALMLKAEAIMDLSCFGKTRDFRQKLVKMSGAMIGTVPIYDAVGFYDKELTDITADEFFKVVKTHVEDGVDFLTIHAGLTKDVAESIKLGKRRTGIVSRGGSLLYRWMEANNKENPFYEYYDRLLDICVEYDVTLSLGDGCRPGSIDDATDITQMHEMIKLAELTKRAWEKNVQVMIEGPGHVPLDQIEANVVLQKSLCFGAPFYVLGPIVTDIAPGYDHITSAIGGAIAAAKGADFLCYVTPAEHLRLPTLEDMKEGIIAAKIAAHAADIVKKVSGAKDMDDTMSSARAALDWDKMLKLAIDPEKAKKYRESSMPEDKETCTMCGKMCAVKNMNEALKK